MNRDIAQQTMIEAVFNVKKLKPLPNGEIIPCDGGFIIPSQICYDEILRYCQNLPFGYFEDEIPITKANYLDALTGILKFKEYAENHLCLIIDGHIITWNLPVLQTTQESDAFFEYLKGLTEHLSKQRLNNLFCLMLHKCYEFNGGIIVQEVEL